ARLRVAPPFLVSRYWFDDPVRGDRPAFLATAGFGPLDNIRILDRYDLDAQRWAARTGGSVVELHAYAVHHQVMPESLRAELQRAYPETAGLRVVDERHERRADCPLFPPGEFAHRPRIRTPDPNVMLAGDLVRVDLPVALMERAATSGLLAANGLLEQWGIRGHEAWSVPNTGTLLGSGQLTRVAGLA
ncbi:MAG: FAD-dependent oxidoreductase, partial [Nocardioidaceae bacterium]